MCKHVTILGAGAFKKSSASLNCSKSEKCKNVVWYSIPENCIFLPKISIKMILSTTI